MAKEGKRFTVAGTDIEEVKQKNAQSGKSYNEVLKALAMGADSREEIAKEAEPFRKTVENTNIAHVRRENNK